MAATPERVIENIRNEWTLKKLNPHKFDILVEDQLDWEEIEQLEKQLQGKEPIQDKYKDLEERFGFSRHNSRYVLWKNE